MRNIPLNGKCFLACIEGNCVEYVEWLLLNNCPIPSSTMIFYLCAIIGRLDLLELFKTKGFIIDTDENVIGIFRLRLACIIRKNINVNVDDFISCLEWLKIKNLKIVSTMFSHPIDVKIILWLRENNFLSECPIPEDLDTIKLLISFEEYQYDKNKFSEIFRKWRVNDGKEKCSSGLEIIKWLVKNSYEINFDKVLMNAIHDHNLELAKFAIDRYVDMNSYIFTSLTIDHNCCKILRYLKDIGKLDYTCSTGSSGLLKMLDSMGIEESDEMNEARLFIKSGMADENLLAAFPGILKSSIHNRCYRLYLEFQSAQ